MKIKIHKLIKIHYTLAVTLRTIKLNVQEFYILPTKFR